MSEPTTPPAAPEFQFKVRITPAIEVEMENQREALGFHSSNALAAVYLATFAGVPADKVWECLAKLKAYHRKGYKGVKSK
jgi:UDP-N-acetylmuramyl pentapeptide synthase